MSTEKKEKLTKVKLKLRRHHKQGFMRLGKHQVKGAYAEYDLNEKELKELSTAGCKHWFTTEEQDKKYKAEAKEAKAAASKRKEAKDKKKK